MKCPRCQNQDDAYFYNGSKGLYCRKCIQFKRILLQEDIKDTMKYPSKVIDTDYSLKFELTPLQKECSSKLKKQILIEDVLVYAACGAGKTEIVMAAIKEALLQGKKVAIAIPRRQVVIEVAKRMQKAFKDLKVVAVCQGYTSETDGDLIVCTTHQLYRYPHWFDLLIIDEPDAFPYKADTVLQAIAKTSCKGRTIYLSATPDDMLLKLHTIKLFKRPHAYPIPSALVVIGFKWYLYVYLIHWLKARKRVLLFVPSIKYANKLAKYLSVECLTSLSEHKEEIIQRFDENVYPYLVCTTVLERGVTFSNVHVVILEADHRVFDESSIIQILGRMGRDPKYPKGDGLLLCLKKSNVVSMSLKKIEQMNA